MLCFDFPLEALEEKSFLTRMNFPSEGIFKEQIQYIDFKSSVLDPILKPTQELKDVRKFSYFSSYDVHCASIFKLATKLHVDVRNALPYFAILCLFTSCRSSHFY